MSVETVHEEWQVESGDQVFSTNLEEMTAWIEDGSMLRIDRVRKGNLRWIEAGKVPTLAALFDARENSQAGSVVVTTSSGTAQPTPPAAVEAFGNTQPSDSDACSVHTETAAVFECETCVNKFCKTCPNSYGGNVKICPFCGAMCRPLSKPERAPVRSYTATGSFGMGDFVTALGYPFRFPAALILGGLMFTLLCVGRSGSSFGGVFAMWGSIACYLLSNTLTFGILANTVENFSQGKIGENFMPSFDNYSLWEDAVHPFFLMIGVNVVSFLPLAAVVLFAFYSVVGPAAAALTDRSPVPATTVGGVDRGIALANAAKHQGEQQNDRVAAINSGELPSATGTNPDSEDDFEELIADVEHAQTAPVAASEPESFAPQADTVRQIVRSGFIVAIGLLISLAWAVFFYPAASAVAGYTRSLGAVLNVTVGLDTIRRLGVSYVKIVAIFVLISVASFVVTAVLNSVFAPFDLPMLGNIPATAVSSFVSFYLSIVFACVLGLALYKRADRLELPQA